jgi:eukaryotic-like serine/threonine-protein kinase
LVRGELDWIVMKCLEKDRSSRYETASAFAADVQRYLSDEAVQACPPSTWYRLRKFARRNKRALVTAALLSGMLLVVAGSLGWMTRDRAARRATLNHQVELALQEASTARDRALTLTDNPPQWDAALAAARSALKQAEGLAAQEEAALEPAVRGRLEEVRATLDADDNDRRFVDRLDQIRLEQIAFDVQHGRFNLEIAFPAIKEAFRTHYGIDFVATPVAQAVSFIQQRPPPIQEYLLAALESSSAHVPKEDLQARQWLAAVLKAADTDPWGQWARAALEARDWPALEKLVQEARTAGQRPVFMLRVVERSPLWEAEAHLDLFRRIQRAFPGDYWVNYSLANVLHYGKKPRLDEALRYYTAAVAIRPRSPATYVDMGNALQRNGDLDGAIAAFREAIALVPGYAGANRRLGDVLMEKGRWDSVISGLRDAIRYQQSAAENPVFWNALGMAYYRAGNWTEAIAALKKAMDLRTGGNSHDWFFLAMAHWKTGNKEEARKWYDQAVEWMEKNQPKIEYLRRFRAEAEELLGVKKK